MIGYSCRVHNVLDIIRQFGIMCFQRIAINLFLKLNRFLVSHYLFRSLTRRVIHIIRKYRKKEGNEVFADGLHIENCLGYLKVFTYIELLKVIKKSLLLA